MPLSFPMVGRERDVSTLLGLAAEAAAGRGSLVLIGGEAGIGKTALLGTLCRDAGQLVPIICHCPGDGETPPFGPWREAVLAAAARCGTDPGVLPPPLGSAPGEWRISETAALLAGWLGSSGRPLLLAVEDFQWADRASMDLLRHLAFRLADQPVLVAVTYRSDELDRGHPLWVGLPGLYRSGAKRIELHRLSADDVAELAASALPGAPAPVIARHLFQRTSGHPLFVTELLAAASRSGVQLGEDGPLPDTVQQAIDRRLSRLRPGTLAVLEVAAVIGERFDVDLLLQVAGAAPDELEDALEEAVALRVLRPEGEERLSFDHALVRDSLAGRLIGPARRRLHLRVAEVVLQSPAPDPDLAAVHLDRAGDSRAVDYLMLAGDRALRLGATGEALERYERALSLALPDDPRRGGLLLKAGFVQRDEEPARVAWEEAARTGDRPVAAWASHLLGLRLSAKGDPSAVAHMERVMAEQEALGGDQGFRRLETDLYGGTLGYPRIAGALAFALAKAGRLAEAEALVQQMQARAVPSARHGDLLRLRWRMADLAGDWEDALELGRLVAEEAYRNGNYEAAFQCEGERLYAILLCKADQPEQVDALVARLTDLATRSRQRAGFTLLEQGFPPLGWYQFLRGDWEGARHNLLGYLARHPGHEEPGVRGFAVMLQVAQGDLAGARSTLAAVPPFRPDDPPGLYSMQIAAYSVRADLHLLQGDIEQARAWLAGADRYLAARKSTSLPAALHLSRARLHIQTGDLQAAQQEGEQALAKANRPRAIRFLITARRLLGEVLAAQGRCQEAEVHFREALSLAAQCRFVYEVAQTQLARGVALPGTSGAREGLAQARESFARLGALPALRAAEAALATPAPPAVLPDGLSEREAEVVRLVAQGLSDKEVGARLFISHRTVDGHLRNVFAKTGVGNRTALAAYASRHGLIDMGVRGGDRL